MMEFLQRTGLIGLIFPLVSAAILVVIVMFLSYLCLIKETHETLERVKRMEEKLDSILKQDSQEQ